MAINENIQELSLNEIMGERFGRYSKYIIQERAIPDIRDGLKPVQRRIIYSMYKEGNTYNKGYRKSAKTVGNVIGNYHPHGDTSVYDAMVRLSQDWKMREPLVDMQGNNGSMDGDPAAAMRYTEARLGKISNALVEDLDKDTVDWVLNFDDTEYEPTILPARFPNLLVNGATGISAGYATDIPPHNLGEVIDAAVYLLKHPNAGLEKLMSFVQGPDFPTGGIIQGLDGLKSAYKNGRGKVVVRSRTSIEKIRGGRQQIIVSEIPYEVNKANIVRQLDDIRFNKEIDGISDVRDETDRKGLRIVIDLNKEVNAEGVLTYLLKETDLQVNYNFNMVAIHDKRPEQVGLKVVLDAYLKHRRTVITRRTRYELDRAENRHHIVEGLIKAVSILDAVIKTIRESKNKADAKKNISTKFSFSEKQAEAIVSLQLYRLSNTDITQLREEARELEDNIARYNAILEDPKVLNGVISDELKATKKEFATPRLTDLEDEVEKLEVEKEILISKEDVHVVVTSEGYIKRTSNRSFAASDPSELGLKDGDYPVFIKEMTTLDHVILFTSKGNAINRPVHSLPDVRWKDNGHHISQEVALEDTEEIIKVFALEEFTDDHLFVLMTRNGNIKQTLASKFEPKRTYKTKSYTAMKLQDEEDALINVEMITAGTDYDIFSVSYRGYGLRYPLEEISEVGPNAKGVISMNLKEDDYVTGATVMNTDNSVQNVMIVTQRGAVKKMNILEFDVTSRAKRGVLVLRNLKANPHYVTFIIPITDEKQELTLYTSIDKQVTILPKEYATVDRQNNGSFVFDEKTSGSPVKYREHILEALADESE